MFGQAVGQHLAQLLQAQRFDIVHAHALHGGATSLLEARRHGLPFVYEKRNLGRAPGLAGKLSGRWSFFPSSQGHRPCRDAQRRRCVRHHDGLKQRTCDLGIPPERTSSWWVTGWIPADLPSGGSVTQTYEQCLRSGDYVVGFIGSFSVRGFAAAGGGVCPLAPGVPGTPAWWVMAKTRLYAARTHHWNCDGDSVWLVGRVPHAQVEDFAAMDA